MKRWIQVRRSLYGGWFVGCDHCPGAWDYDVWGDAIRAADIHACWHFARRYDPTWADA